MKQLTMYVLSCKSVWALVLVGLGSAGLAQPGVTTNFHITRGVRESGSLASLLAPDGNKLAVRGSSGDFHFCEIDFTSENPLFTLATAVRINLYAKLSRTSVGNISADVFNWRRSRWETRLIRYDVRNIDMYNQIAAGREFFSSTGKVKLRFRSQQSTQFRLRFDALWITVSPG